jgi:hypothetical protein
MMQFSFFTNMDELIKLDEVQDEPKPENRPIRKIKANPDYPIRDMLEGERHHDRLFKGMAKLRHGIARAGLKYSVSTEMHIIGYLNGHGISPEATCDWQPELVDLWIENYLDRANQSA